MNIIEARNITKKYTGHTALDDVSVSIPQGSIYGLLGPNGAGKTTLIRIINHITAPDKGEVIFDGHRLCADDVVHIGYLPEERGLYKKMKVGEQAMFFAKLKGLKPKEAERQLKQWFERFGIMNWWGKKVEELSKGMAQKVQFIVTVLHRPKLLIFDEPFSGFDPINADLLKREILKLRDEGATVIFSTHNMGSVEELCDEITLINRSRNILSGNVHELRKTYGGNNFELTYVGSPDALTAAVSPVASSFSLGGIDRDGRASAQVSLNSPDDLRTLISAANEAVSLKGFHQLLPSMDSIFISAVEASNNTYEPQTENTSEQ